MNQSNQRKDAGSNSEEMKAQTTAELQATGGAATGMVADKECVESRRTVVSEIEIFRGVLEGLTPKEDVKIRNEIRAIKASHKRLKTLLKQGVTPEALYNATAAKGFTISREEFLKIVRTITHPRPRVARVKAG